MAIDTEKTKDPEITSSVDLSGEESPGNLDIIIGEDGGASIELADKEGIEKEKKPAGEDRKKRTGRLNQRLGQMAAQRDEAIRVARESETTAERLRRELEELRAKSQETDAAALTHFEAATTANLERAKQKLKQARESGDVDAETEAVAEVGKYSAEKGRIDAWKANQKPAAEGEGQTEEEPAPRKEKPAPQETQAEREAKFSPELKGFIDENPWFRPNTAEFDLEMHKEAVAYGNLLERKWIRAGRQDEVGTPEYYAEIRKHVMTEFPDYEGDEIETDEKPAKKTNGQPQTKRTMPAMGRDENILPARSESAPNGETRSTGPRRIQLNSDQQEFARSMAEQGAPGYVHPDGRHYSPQEAYVRYAKAIERDAHVQKQAGRSA